MTENVNLPPLNEEDMAAVMSMINRLVRMRKRQAANNSDVIYIGDAIEALQSFGQIKGWWK